MAARDPHAFRYALLRSLRLRCPRCGLGRTLKSWFAHHPCCSQCGLRFVPDPVDLGMFLYLSTAAVTGAYLIGYFLIGFPESGWGRFWVGASGVGLMVLTAPLRRSLGIGILYLAEIFFSAER